MFTSSSKSTASSDSDVVLFRGNRDQARHASKQPHSSIRPAQAVQLSSRNNPSMDNATLMDNGQAESSSKQPHVPTNSSSNAQPGLTNVSSTNNATQMSKAQANDSSKKSHVSINPSPNVQPSSTSVSETNKANPMSKSQANDSSKKSHVPVNPSPNVPPRSTSVSEINKATQTNGVKARKPSKPLYTLVHRRNHGKPGLANAPTTNSVSHMGNTRTGKAPRKPYTVAHLDQSPMNMSATKKATPTSNAQAETLPKQSHTAILPQPSPASVAPIGNVQAEKGGSIEIAAVSCRPNGSTPMSKQKKPPVAMKKDPYALAPQEVLDELKRLRQPIIRQAHLNRFKCAENPASPETLARVRDGPGTDMTSGIYGEIQEVRELPAAAATMGPRFGSTRIFPRSDLPQGRQRFLAQWTAYQDAPRLYPTVENKKISLSPMPEPGQAFVEIPEDLRQGLDPGLETVTKHAAENKWAGPWFADWEYRPRLCSQYEAFRDCFRKWLELAMGNVHPVDIFHEAFFDGSAHPDGMGSLYIGDFEHEYTRLDLEHDETRLHCHETVLGYIHNYGVHVQKLKDEERAKKIRTRAAYIEATKHLSKQVVCVPRTNIYLRHVELGDIDELAIVMNWYMDRSPLSTDDELVSLAQVRQRIVSSRAQQYPFIVAVQRRGPGVSQSPSTSERILGYAVANDFIDRESSTRYTARLQVFVRHEEKRKGIGRCLMDKLLEACDPTFKSKSGYYFHSDNDNSGAPRAGGRKLARLIFLVSYLEHDRASYEGLIKWLNKYSFEEQGVLKGIAVKFGRYLNVAYMVRNVGPSGGGSFHAY